VLLDSYTELLTAVKKFGPERRAAISDIQSRLPDFRQFQYRCVAFFYANLGQIVPAEDRLVAQLGCAVAAIACERYRQKTGSWPKALADIPKEVLPEIPTDPFSGNPVLYKRTETGAVVYSVGADGVDDGGETLDPKMPPGTDVGIRLFDPAHRRLPARPKPPAVGEDRK
jgi:hypothetical protein